MMSLDTLWMILIINKPSATNYDFKKVKTSQKQSNLSLFEGRRWQLQVHGQGDNAVSGSLCCQRC